MFNIVTLIELMTNVRLICDKQIKMLVQANYNTFYVSIFKLLLKYA